MGKIARIIRGELPEIIDIEEISILKLEEEDILDSEYPENNKIVFLKNTESGVCVVDNKVRLNRFVYCPKTKTRNCVYGGIYENEFYIARKKKGKYCGLSESDIEDVLAVYDKISIEEAKMPIMHLSIM